MVYPGCLVVPIESPCCALQCAGSFLCMCHPCYLNGAQVQVQPGSAVLYASTQVHLAGSYHSLFICAGSSAHVSACWRGPDQSG